MDQYFDFDAYASRDYHENHTTAWKLNINLKFPSLIKYGLFEKLGYQTTKSLYIDFEEFKKGADPKSTSFTLTLNKILRPNICKVIKKFGEKP